MSSQSSFKQTPIGPIPREWEVVRLRDVADYINGYAFSPRDWKSEGLPIIRIQNLNDPNAEFNYFDGEIDGRYIIENGDLLFSWSASLGAYIWNRGRAILNQHIFKVVPKEKVEKSFLYYALFLAIEQLRSRVHGSTMKHFKRSELKTLIPLPPLPEQHRIAEILSTVDQAIQGVDEAIARTERLKRGLMQRLLTRGIGHREFKDTEIGWIPKEWEVVGLGDEGVAEIRSNRVISGFEKVTFIPMELIPDSGIFANYELRPMDEVKSSTYCERGDLLLAKITPSLENGKQGIVPDDVPNGFALATTEVFPIVPKGVDKLYLFYLLKFPKFRNKIIASMIGTTGRQRASKESVEKLKIPLPPQPEQRKIAEVLSTVDEKLELERKRKEKLERIKRGLMNDLLTGRKRVAPESRTEKDEGERRR
jgi:type I restriction enzyme S subunit